MSSDPSGIHAADETAAVIRVSGLSKCYQIYERPEDRLKQALMPRLRRLLRREARPYHREFWALRDVSFSVRKGETLGVIGRNGSGKSTLLQIICGILTPSSGHVEVHGRVAALLELGSGFNPEFTGHENIYMSGAILGLTREQIDERYADIVAFADIGAFVGQPVKTYSSGMYVRLAFAVIAHADADILIIDEALSVGDAVFAQKCMRFLRSFMARGTLIFVSHDVGSVLGLCQTAVWLDQGEVRMSGDAKEVTDSYMRDCMEIAAGQGFSFEQIGPTGEAIDADVGTRDSRPLVQASFFDNIAHSKGWTTHAASLGSVRVTDEQGNARLVFSGGESMELFVTATAHAELASPIIGFLVKDRLGQSLFGEHTYAGAAGCPVNAGESLMARFCFTLPLLQDGEYSVTVSIADGTPAQHVQHHWLHDAMILKVSSPRERHGLVAIAFKHISLRKV